MATVNIINASNLGVDTNTVFKTIIGGGVSQNVLQYIQQKYNEFANNMQNVGYQFLDRVQQMQNYLANNETITTIQKNLMAAGSVYGDEVIHPINYQNIHHPGYLMRRYIMADPTIYNLYQNNRCSGWDDEWFDPEPNTRPEWRDDYRFAMDGVMQHDEDGNGFVMFYSTSEDNPLTMYERFKVNEAWDVLHELMAAGIDPTSYQEDDEL